MIQRVRVGQGVQVFPQNIRAVVFDFDGVMTDNSVIVDENGKESVVCNRSDGLGIDRLKAAGIFAAVLSKEVNPVVVERCAKLKLPCRQGIDEKAPELIAWMQEIGVPRENVAYVGNDLNDLECLRWAGVGIAVADAEPEILAATYVHTVRCGGHGAVRDVCEWIIDGHTAARAAAAPVR